MNGMNGPAIAAEQRVPADNGQFLQHLHAVAQVADAGARVVSPAHRNFLDLISALERDEKNLRVEPPALDRLKLKYSLRGAPSKCLEATLRVRKGKVHHHSGQQVEASAEELPVKRLAMRLPAGGQPAGADGDIRSPGNDCKQSLRLIDRRRQIGVGKHHHVAQRLQDPVAYAVTFAAIGWVFKQTDLGGSPGEFPHDFGSVIS